MKIIYKQGDFLEGPEPYKLHGCNAQGVMGSGAALAVRKKFPKAYEEYKKYHREYGLQVGRVVCYHLRDITVINAIIQEYYGRDADTVYVDYSGVESIMQSLDRQAKYLDYTPQIAMPKIGAGLANGDWEIISKIIEDNSENFQAIVYTL